MKYKVGDWIKWHCFKYRVVGYKLKDSKMVTVVGDSGVFCTLHENEVKPIITFKAELA